MQKPPSLRNNNGSLQVRVRIDGKDAFINRLGRWSDPVAVAKAHAIAAQIWSDYCQGTFDRSLMSYQPLINGKEVGLLEALRVRAETKRQAAAIHAYRLLQRYGLPIRNRSEAEAFLGWLRAEGLSDCTIAGLMTHYRQCSGGNRHLFSHKLKWQRRSVQSDVLSVEEIQAVLADLENHEPWYYPLFLLWLSTGMRNAEIRGLTWDCIRWEEGEVLEMRCHTLGNGDVTGPCQSQCCALDHHFCRHGAEERSGTGPQAGMGSMAATATLVGSRTRPGYWRTVWRKTKCNNNYN